MSADRIFDGLVERLVQHVFPLSGRPHDTSGGPCWCDPRPMQPCVVCGDEPRRSCFDCGGRGLVDEFDPIAPLLVVHRAPRDHARLIRLDAEARAGDWRLP